MSGTNKTLLIAIVAVSLLGLLDSGYATYEHYAPPQTAFCNVNETMNCDAVNQSPYSEIMRVPVAGIGFAGYLLFAGLTTGMLLTGRQGHRRVMWVLLAAAIAVALTFSLILTFIEVLVIQALCPLCLISLSLILVLTLLVAAGSRLKGSRRNAAAAL